MDSGERVESMAARIAIVAAMDRHRAIGRDNQLPWQLPDDLAHFKALTLNQTILMGRRTAESLGRALPKRRNLVLTHSGSVPFAGMEIVEHLDQAIALAGVGETLFVIGGGAVYAQTLAQASVLHLTLIDCAIDDADTHFPQFDPAQWRVSSRVQHAADARHAHAFEFVDMERIF